MSPLSRARLLPPVVALLLTTAPVLVAQARPEPDVEAPAPQELAGDPSPEALLAPGTRMPFDSHQSRDELADLLRRSPPELGRILALDPTLLSNHGFLADHPQLAAFLATHPEIRHSPRFYLAAYAPHEGGDFDHLFEGLMVLFSFGLAILAAGWLIRTIIEQGRWNRLSRTQSEVHNKILERVGSSEALLEYMRSPAGTKFLEAAPIQVAAEGAASAPVARVLWSIQIGVVVAAGAIGLLLVSSRFEAADAQALHALGVVGLCLGGGFVASALVSLLVSRRLGLWQGPPAPGPGYDTEATR
jgi:hypothetical protein